MLEETRWPGLDDKLVVAEMLRNPQSDHWTGCHKFITRLIGKLRPHLPFDLREDALQETMASVHNGLPNFRFDSKLTTWLASIARHRVIDVERKYTAIIFQEVHMKDTPDDREESLDTFPANLARMPEEEFLTRENLKEIIAEIEAFIKKHAKTERNRQILQMVLLDDYSCEETARILGVNAPVVSHVVRSARGHLREWMRHR
jgi:RNA polymerase sigma-70 factor, ECF subfamily